MIPVTKKDIKPGAIVWMSGPWKEADFVQIYAGEPEISGPYFVKRSMFFQEEDELVNARVDILNPENGEEKSVMSSWLRVPKEEKCRK